MSIIDKFLDVMRLNDDDYEFDNEDYDYDEEEDYEVKEKNLPAENAKKKRNSSRSQQLLIFPKSRGRSSRIKLHQSTETADRDNREWKYV